MAALFLVLIAAGDCPVCGRARHAAPRRNRRQRWRRDAWRQRLTWIALAFVPSSLLLGVTTYITTDIASAPLLWVVPLALYLLSFIIAFVARNG